MYAYAYNPSAWEAEARGLWVQGSPGYIVSLMVHSKTMSLDSTVRPCLKIINSKKKIKKRKQQKKQDPPTSAAYEKLTPNPSKDKQQKKRTEECFQQIEERKIQVG